MSGLTVRRIRCGFRIDPVTGEHLPLTSEQQAWSDKMLDGVSLQSAPHPHNPGRLRGRRIKKASLETVTLEMPDDAEREAEVRRLLREGVSKFEAIRRVYWPNLTFAQYCAYCETYGRKTLPGTKASHG